MSSAVGPRCHDFHTLPFCAFAGVTMPSSANTGRESDKFNLRLPDGMRDRIADAAKASGRSMNSEIVARVEKSFTAVSQETADWALEAVRKIVLADPVAAVIADADVEAALLKFAAESDMRPVDALAAAFRDWAIGNGYLELPPDREDAN